MTTAAIIFMLLSVSSVVILTIWCYYRVLTTPRRPDPSIGSDHSD